MIEFPRFSLLLVGQVRVRETQRCRKGSLRRISAEPVSPIEDADDWELATSFVDVSSAFAFSCSLTPLLLGHKALANGSTLERVWRKTDLQHIYNAVLNMSDGAEPESAKPRPDILAQDPGDTVKVSLGAVARFAYRSRCLTGHSEGN